MPVGIPLLAFACKVPADGLPMLTDWLGTAQSIWGLGFEGWRESTEIRPLKEELLGQDLDYGAVEAVKGSGRISVLLWTYLYMFLEMKHGLTSEEQEEFKR